MSPLLGRSELLALLDELAERLARRGVRAAVYVVGGAAMALEFDDRRSTRDIDSVILEGHGPLIEEVRSIARLRGLPSTWLNDQASRYVASGDDPGRQVVFDHPSLSVAAASAERLLAMKLVAARASDVADIAALLSLIGITTVAEAELVLTEAFADRPLSNRARLIVEDLLGGQ